MKEKKNEFDGIAFVKKSLNSSTAIEWGLDLSLTSTDNKKIEA